MDEWHRLVLSRHWAVICRYMEVTPELLAALGRDAALPEYALAEVRAAATRRDKCETLLQAVKLRGTNALVKLRETLFHQGQPFVADLLFDEDRETLVLVQEADLLAVPNLKLSLGPEDLQRLASALDAKARFRMLKAEWREDSGEKLTSLANRVDSYSKMASVQTNLQNNLLELQKELTNKTDLIRAMSQEVAALQSEASALLSRHRLSSTVAHTTMTVTHGRKGNDNATRFRPLEQDIHDQTFKLHSLLGGRETNLDTLYVMPDLEAAVNQLVKYVQALAKENSVASKTGSDVDETEKNERMVFLNAIDKLSRCMRGMDDRTQNQGLKTLQQSAVTGQPTPDIVDFRFLCHHLALLEVDAGHMAKRLGWRDAEVTALRQEITALRRRAKMRKESPEYTPPEVPLGD